MLDRKDIEVLQEMFARLENAISHEVDRVRDETNRRIDQLEHNMELLRQEIFRLFHRIAPASGGGDPVTFSSGWTSSCGKRLCSVHIEMNQGFV